MKWFSRQKLNAKFTAVISLIVFIPLVVIYIILYGNLKKSTISQARSLMENTMVQTYSEVQKTVDLCNMSTQMFLNNQNLKDFLVRLKRGDDIPTEEIVAFYQNDIAMLERLVNSNPYLYRIRVYAQNDDFSEMMPILFRQQRMEALPWADSYVSGQWQFDYKDEVFGSLNTRAADHVMSLVTEIEDYELGTIGVLEVAVDMSRIFPYMFEEEAGDYSSFVDEYGTVYTGNWPEECSGLREELLAKVQAQDIQAFYDMEAKAGKETVVIGCIPVRELSGYLMQVSDLHEEIHMIDGQRNIFLVVIAVVFLAVLLLTNWIVKVLLGRFYCILGTIRQVQEGNLEVQAPEDGNDEISELGAQINKMLDRIQILIGENVNRELLVKNSEIRALQNQINAHFIYNVLESIKMMAEIQEEYDISDAVTSLGRLLRYSMRWVSQEVTVREEIQYIRDYLDLINLRYDYEIMLSLNIPDLVYEQKIPKMSLQPIVENAIVHGIEELAENASIYIKAKVFEEYFVLEITDSGKGMTAAQVKELERKIAGEIEVSGGSGNGIGLKNVQDRIRIAFGEPYGIGVISREGCFTKVTVTIPITRGEEKGQHEKPDDSRR
ncbi:MAG: sensor histidine kinase [Lachnospiraceae bacterium]|nr:sensor histidine kinase [Lachnospiraceae bacterium]